MSAAWYAGLAAAYHRALGFLAVVLLAVACYRRVMRLYAMAPR